MSQKTHLLILPLRAESRLKKKAFAGNSSIIPDLNYFADNLVVVPDTSALWAQIDLDVIQTAGSSSYGLHTLWRHHCFAFRTGSVFFHHSDYNGSVTA
jgi:hypothetical protein